MARLLIFCELHNSLRPRCANVAWLYVICFGLILACSVCLSVSLVKVSVVTHAETYAHLHTHTHTHTHTTRGDHTAVMIKVSAFTRR